MKTIPDIDVLFGFAILCVIFLFGFIIWSIRGCIEPETQKYYGNLCKIPIWIRLLYIFICCGSSILYYLYNKRLKNKPKFKNPQDEEFYNKNTQYIYISSIILGIPLGITIIIVICAILFSR